MTPPERPEVAALKSAFESHVPGPVCDRFEAHLHMADGSIRTPAAAEPLRGALRERLIEALNANAYRGYWSSDHSTMQPMSWREDDVVDRIIADAALEATAPSTPEPALDVERLAMAIHDSDDRDADPTDRPFCPACLADAQRYADRYRALTSEPRAAAPQEGD